MHVGKKQGLGKIRLLGYCSKCQALTSLSRRKHIHVVFYYCFITYHLPWTWPFLTFSVQVDCILHSSKDKL